jgi:cytochrome b subunit of formate dehydrogenase
MNIVTSWRRGLLCAALFLPVLPALQARAVEDAECLFCHGDVNFSATMADGTVRHLYVDEEAFGASVHGKEGCASCHADAEADHKPGLKKVNCGDCHEESDAYAKSPHGILLSEGSADVNGCSDCHGDHDIRAIADPLSHVSKANQPKTCGKCHTNPNLVKDHLISVANPSDSYLKSGHAHAIATGNNDAAACTSCHGSHELLPSDDPASTVYRKNVSKTCGKCHPKALEQYEQSIHGRALAAGIKDAPTCADCHGEHDIEGPKLRESQVNARRQAVDTCTKCHDNEKLMSRYGVVTGRQASYMDSYHGLASAGGSEVVASCASCHENHLILAMDDPASSVHKANLTKTCGKCHENATENFAQGKVHIMPTDPGQKALGIVRILYMLLIAGVIGGMVFHNTLSMARKAMTKFWTEMGDVGTYRRFTRGMTIGHLILTLSFTALAVSGFALRYPEAWWVKLLFHGERGLAARGLVHREAALVLVGIALVNAWFLVFTAAGRKELWMLMMGIGDIRDMFLNMAYMVGLRKHPPLFDRYSYIEKFEYWGMWWGTLLMILTGFSMWFVNVFLQYLPKVALDVIALVHFYEAWLAVLTIIVWHLYYMIFDPHTYPMNWSWITGRITVEDFKERHPLEYARESGKTEKGDAETGADD